MTEQLKSEFTTNTSSDEISKMDVSVGPGLRSKVEAYIAELDGISIDDLRDKKDNLWCLMQEFHNHRADGFKILVEHKIEYAAISELLAIRIENELADETSAQSKESMYKKLLEDSEKMKAEAAERAAQHQAEIDAINAKIQMKERLANGLRGDASGAFDKPIDPIVDYPQTTRVEETAEHVDATNEVEPEEDYILLQTGERVRPSDFKSEEDFERALGKGIIVSSDNIPAEPSGAGSTVASQEEVKPRVVEQPTPEAKAVDDDEPKIEQAAKIDTSQRSAEVDPVIIKDALMERSRDTIQTAELHGGKFGQMVERIKEHPKLTTFASVIGMVAVGWGLQGLSGGSEEMKVSQEELRVLEEELFIGEKLTSENYTSAGLKAAIDGDVELALTDMAGEEYQFMVPKKNADGSDVTDNTGGKVMESSPLRVNASLETAADDTYIYLDAYASSEDIVSFKDGKAVIDRSGIMPNISIDVDGTGVTPFDYGGVDGKIPEGEHRDRIKEFLRGDDDNSEEDEGRIRRNFINNGVAAIAKSAIDSPEYREKMHSALDSYLTESSAVDAAKQEFAEATGLEADKIEIELVGDYPDGVELFNIPPSPLQEAFVKSETASVSGITEFKENNVEAES